MFKRLIHVPIVTISVMTVFINPWTAPDPINQPKLFVGLLGFALILPTLIGSFKVSLNKFNIAFLVPASIFFIFLVLSTISSDGELWEKLWGVYGRSTGALAYLIILLSFLSGLLLGPHMKAEMILLWLIRTGYVVSFYAILQIAELDPISWVSSGQVGFSTLGNINYVSAFLGLTNCAMFIKCLDRENALTSRVWFALICLVNFWIFFESGSMQGFLIFSTGITSQFLITLRGQSKNFLNWSGFAALYVALWSLGFCGLAGIGPLGKYISQETMIFRSDYWRAGFRMIIDSPWVGKGPDSYGSYYREFRDFDATFRTEPSRFSNSAHSVLIDIGVSFGIFAVISLISIVLILYFKLVQLRFLTTYRVNSKNSTHSALVAVAGGFISTFLFSISQIAIMSWGFLILGWLAQVVSRSGNLENNEPIFSYKTVKAKSSKIPKTMIRTIPTCLSFLCVLIMLVSPRFLLDRDFKESLASGDMEFLAMKTSDPYTPIGYGYLALDVAITQNLLEPSLTIAKKIVERNPREYVSWTIIARHPNSTPKERSYAKQMLRSLDPLNPEHK
jgi:hypothetical protein